MSTPAFRASYHGWRLAMGRGMVQIVIEVPIEDSDKAYQVLGGMPNPGKPVWIGCARIPEFTDAEAATGRDDDGPDPGDGLMTDDGDANPEPHDKRVVMMAALRCKDARFQVWLRSIGRIPEASEEEATAYIRRIAGGQRRNFGRPGFESETETWKNIDRKFAEHLDGLRYSR